MAYSTSHHKSTVILPKNSEIFSSFTKNYYLCNKIIKLNHGKKT